MVVEYNDEYCKIILRKDINTEPYEVIDIVDLLEVWEQHTADTPQTENVVGNKATLTIKDGVVKVTPQTDCGWK